MNQDKRKVLVLILILFAALLGSLFLKVDNSRVVAAVILVPFAVAASLLVKKRGSLSINKREVLMMMAIIAVLYVICKEMTGIYFGFYKNPYFVTSKRFLSVVLPTIVIIIAIEWIRYVILAQKMKSASVLTYLSCIVTDILIYSNFSGITSFNRFMDLVGLTLFPALSANVLYHFVSKRYGMIPNVVFRCITMLYINFIPVSSGMSDALDSCIGIITPIAFLALVSAMFDKKTKRTKRKNLTVEVISTALALAIVISVTMLISCQFRYGALVIATESMTGEINKGDVIVYERYEQQALREGQVIVFAKDNVKIVHRVVRIENINGETRYYTKGDANPDEDYGYRLSSDIVGLTDVKVAYIGFPTLWIRELLEGNN